MRPARTGLVAACLLLACAPPPPALAGAIGGGGGGASQGSGVATTDSPQGLVDAGRPREARALAMDRIARFPGSEEDHLALARASSDLLDWNGALAALERAAVLFPRSPAVHVELATLLENRTRFTSAIEEYRLAVSLDPQDIDTRTELAGLLMRRGDLSGAVEQYQALGRLEPDEPAHPLALANLYQALGQAQLAEQARQVAVRLDPALAEHAPRPAPLPQPPPPGLNPQERDEEQEMKTLEDWAAHGQASRERAIVHEQSTVAPDTALIRRIAGKEGTLLQFRVIASLPVDVMLFSEEAAAAYRQVLQAGSGVAAPEWVHTSVTTIDLKWAFPRTGAYALVVDNSFYPPGGAQVGEPVSVDVLIARPGPQGGAPGPLHVPYTFIAQAIYIRGTAGLTLTAQGAAAMGGLHVTGHPAGLSGGDVLIDQARVGP